MKLSKISVLFISMIFCNLTLVAQTDKSNRDFPEKKVFIGLHAGYGAGLYAMEEEYIFADNHITNPNVSVENYLYTYGYFTTNVGVDVAIPVTKLFYIGPYFSIGRDFDELFYGAGITMMFNFKNKSAIMATYGIDFYPTSDRWFGDCSRISYKFPRRLYLGLEAMTSQTAWETIQYIDNGAVRVYGSDVTLSFLFHIGFRLF